LNPPPLTGKSVESAIGTKIDLQKMRKEGKSHQSRSRGGASDRELTCRRKRTCCGLTKEFSRKAGDVNHSGKGSGENKESRRSFRQRKALFLHRGKLDSLRGKGGGSSRLPATAELPTANFRGGCNGKQDVRI